jgi:hypothetical protein
MLTGQLVFGSKASCCFRYIERCGKMHRIQLQGLAAPRTEDTGAMANSSRERAKIFLSDHRGLGRVYVDLAAFFDFSFALSEELEDLVGKWAGWSTPRNIVQLRDRKFTPRGKMSDLG